MAKNDKQNKILNITNITSPDTVQRFQKDDINEGFVIPKIGKTVPKLDENGKPYFNETIITTSGSKNDPNRVNKQIRYKLATEKDYTDYYNQVDNFLRGANDGKNTHYQYEKERLKELFGGKIPRNELNKLRSTFIQTRTIDNPEIKNILSTITGKQTDFIRMALSGSDFDKDFKNEYSNLKREYYNRLIDIQVERDDDGDFYYETDTLKIKSTRATNWFKSKIQRFIDDHKDISKPNNIYSLIMDDKTNRSTSNVKIGGLYMFYYTPKHWKKLNVYDMFPLVLIVGRKDDKLIGLNLHYVSSGDRLKALLACLNAKPNEEYYDSFSQMTKTSLNKDISETIQRILEDEDINFLMDESLNLNDEIENLTKRNRDNEKKRNELLLKERELSKRRTLSLREEEEFRFEITELLKDIQDTTKKLKDAEEKLKKFRLDTSKVEIKNDILDKIKKNEKNYISNTYGINKKGYAKYSKQCFRYYLFTGGHVMQNRYIYVPPSEYRFVVNLPPYWIENKKTNNKIIKNMEM